MNEELAAIVDYFQQNRGTCLASPSTSFYFSMI